MGWRWILGRALDFTSFATKAGKQMTRRSRATTRDSTSGAASRSGATLRVIGYRHKKHKDLSYVLFVPFVANGLLVEDEGRILRATRGFRVTNNRQRFAVG